MLLQTAAARFSDARKTPTAININDHFIFDMDISLFSNKSCERYALRIAAVNDGRIYDSRVNAA